MSCRPAPALLVVMLLLGAGLGPRLLAGSGTAAASVSPSAAPASPAALGAWRSFPSPVTNELSAVAMASASEGWAVGREQAGQHGPVLYWDGQSWRAINLLPCTDPDYGCTGYHAATTLPSGDAWVTAAGTIPHYNDLPWSAVDHWKHSEAEERGCGQELWPGNPLLGVSAISTTDVWAVGYGQIVHWNGSHCAASMPSDGTSLQAVDMISPTDGWAVGLRSDQPGEYRPAALHWDGAAWTDAGLTGFPGYYLTSVAMVSASQGWAVGAPGIILSWDGAHWTEATAPTSDSLLGLTMLSATDGWAVGEGGTILHYDGGAWRKMPSPTTADLTSVAMVSASDGWIVGSGGVILRYSLPAPVVALRAGSHPTVDGNADEWSGLEATYLDQTNAATITGDNSTPADLSLLLRSAWTPDMLYFGVTIWDDVLIGNDSANLWEDDTLELGFYNPATGASHQFSVGVDGRQADQGILISSLTVATATIPGGWNIEVAVPASALGTGPLAADQQYPFTFGHWDDDLGHHSRGQTHMIWLGSSTYAYEPAWGVLELSGTSHDYPQPAATSTPTPSATPTASPTATPSPPGPQPLWFPLMRR